MLPLESVGASGQASRGRGFLGAGFGLKAIPGREGTEVGTCVDVLCQGHRPEQLGMCRSPLETGRASLGDGG